MLLHKEIYVLTIINVIQVNGAEENYSCLFHTLLLLTNIPCGSNTVFLKVKGDGVCDHYCVL